MRSRGAEVGIRTKAMPNLDSSISLFYIHQDSELFFDGDTGDTTAGLPSQRTGIEFTNDYRLRSWLHIDADLALSRARFLGFDNGPGGALPVPCRVSAGPDRQRSGQLRLQCALDGGLGRHHARRKDRLVQCAALALHQLAAAHRGRRISVAAVQHHQRRAWATGSTTVGAFELDALNLLNSTTDQATYAYGSVLNSDSLFAMCYPTMKVPAAVCQNGVMDYVVHPVEPLAVRFTLGGPLETIDPPAMAAELWRKIPDYRAPAAHYDWTGFSIGAHVDGGWSKSSTINTVTGAPAAPGDVSPSGWHGGIQLGYDYMTPSRLVVGISGDVSSGARNTTTIAAASGISANENNVFDSETARGRLGYAIDNILLYGTAGLAWSNNPCLSG